MRSKAALLAVGTVLAAIVMGAGLALADQQGVLAPGASVEVDSDADSFSSFFFWHDAKKSETVEVIGPGASGTVVKQLTIDPNQRVGYSASYHGKKVKLQNKGDAPVNYKVD